MRWTQILWNGNMQEIRPASWIQLIVWITMVCYENNCMKKLQVLCFFCWGRKINIEVPFETTVTRVSWESVWAHAESKKKCLRHSWNKSIQPTSHITQGIPDQGKPNTSVSLKVRLTGGIYKYWSEEQLPTICLPTSTFWCCVCCCLPSSPKL